MEQEQEIGVGTHAVAVEVHYAPVVNFALQQNDVPSLREVVLENQGTPLTDLVVRVEASGGLSPAWEARLASLGAGEVRRLQRVDLRLDPGRLANQLERERVELTVTVSADGRQVGRWSGSLDVLAFNEWPGLSVLPEILAAFVTPNHPAVEGLLGAVRDELGKATGDPSLSGYQSGTRERAAASVTAIYEALRAARVSYINPPASYELEGQKVRTPAEVLDGSRLGTCLDLALVAAAAIEQAGLHPVVLLVQGHAFVGAWLQDEQFSEAAVDDASRVLNRVRLGEIAVFETTSACAGKDIAYPESGRLAAERLARTEEFLIAVDVRAARRAGIRPLPPRVRTGDAFVVVQATAPAGPGPTPTAPGPRGEGEVPTPLRRRREQQAPLDLPEEAVQRLEQWKRRLLDLSLRNPLLNFKVSAKKVVPLLAPDIAALEDLVASGRPVSVAPRSGVLDPRGPRDLTLEKERSGRDIPAEMLLEELRRGLVRADLGQEFDASVVELFRAARLALEETGTNTLFLALGSLVWYESPSSTEKRVAPAVLVPVRLERPSPGQYRVVAVDEEPRVNPALLEKLRHDFDLDTSAVESVGDDVSGFDVRGALAALTRLIMDVPRWEVRDTAHLGLFSFAKLVLYADLDERLAAVSASPVVRQILDRTARANDDSPFPGEEDLDRVKDASAAVYPVDADSSQAAAVEAALAGKSFVLKGPPGTGKSQTITNLIARAAYAGKRILFVAEKRAALEVVERRLRGAGLGPFVLEVHSSKAGKKEVLLQLRTALDAAGSAPPDGWEAEAGRLAGLRDELNAYVAALHRRRESGECVFDAVSRLASLGDATRVRLEIARPAEVTADRLSALRDAVATTALHAGAAGEVSGHPLRGVRATAWRIDLEDQAVEALSEASAAAEALGVTVTAWLSALGLEESGAAGLTGGEMQHHLALAKLAVRHTCPSRALLEEPGWEAIRRDLADAAAEGRRRDSARADLLTRYRREFLELDHAAVASALRQAGASFVFVRWLKRRRAVAPVVAVAIRGRAGDDASVLSDLAKGQEVRECTDRLRRADSKAIQMLGVCVRNAEGDWDAIDAVVAWAGEVRKTLAGYPGGGAVSPESFRSAALGVLDPDAGRLEEGTSARASARGLIAAAGRLNDCLTRLKNLLDASGTALTGAPGDPLLPTLSATLKRWAGALPRLGEWAAWQRCRRREDVPELRHLLDDIEAGRLAPAHAAPAFEAAWAKAWLAAVMPSDPALKDFTHEGHQRLIDRFREADRKVQELSRRVIAATLAAQVPRSSSATVSQNSEVGILRRQLQLQRNHKPVRRLVKELPTLLPRLKPVWLMSPLSVAQYLDPSMPPFDLVVFDEASQIPVWDAVGAMARGARAVVVGDPKQLPPTNFFTRQEDPGDGPAPDEHEVEELESILDECLASAIPDRSLRWHYRSRHESLIAFSNHHYYENELLTFPSAEDKVDHLGVSLRHIPHGRYDRGGSRTNRVEAEAVVDDVFRRLASGDGRSIGVVTFSAAQQILIEDLIDARLRDAPHLQPYFTAGLEPVFVKNLENVQGDERDVILFSVCYGPDASGKFSLGFGPLNRDGGERRLNVAVTRARQQVVVFSSIRADDIDLSRSRAKGLAHLRTFLDYAARGPRVLREVVTTGGYEDWESPFEMAVCKELRQLGWTVDTQVGCSGYRIDLGVRDRDRPGRYLIGIECDGASYHSAKTARDRDRLRQQVLEGLGWNLHRVWSTDWLQNRRRCVERILAAIEQARVKAATRSAPAPADDSAPAHASPGPSAGLGEAEPVAVLETDPIDTPTDPGRILFAEASADRARTLPPDATPYVTYHFPGVGRSPDLFYAARSDRRLAEDLCALVNAEGPIHRDRAYLAVARAWGLQRVTNRVTDRLNDILAGVGRSVLRQEAFLWPGATEPGERTVFRVPTDDEGARPIEHIPSEELAAATLSLLRQHLGLPAVDLHREVAAVFGIRRVSATTRERLEAVVSRLASGGECRVDDGQVRLSR